jgi:hypothetical protein
MTHLTDDEILELALLRGEPDAPDSPHLRDCASCAARYQAALSEGDVLRRAFPAVDAPARRGAPVLRWNRAAIAAALVLGAALGALAFRAPSRPTVSPRSLVRVENALRRIPEEIETLRGAERARLEAEYPRLLSKAEDLYGEFLELTLGEPSPLTVAQRTEIRNAVDTLCARIWTERDPVKLAVEFRESLQAALNPEQFEVFQARLLGDLENDREEEIDILSDDLAEALNLRFSEEERVRAAVRSRYPRTELPRLSLAQWPPDQLAHDPELAAAVREAIPAEHRGSFDRYLEALRSNHERIERLARSMPGAGGR